ncbi:type IV toxin-antitoxin system AbiEi family antitoxin [Amycolatopsis rhabdoformis]|uniref:Type IV toxin-antitoxin system AbiEi family antitoxin n=1 Tax=Amycolatopsis rhabdoformis TaxID=1448059 RepID=A0ABZ1I5H7_9PSEU|nr:type IV toxin-antitoxin system AbiEi family antitoxin [Amycolatopsis rhabdoformis]WSE29677.1 type IV toxin-antitoxin system AbiEi family antitoxin [Amycolatopsis rhabdoformis]
MCARLEELGILVEELGAEVREPGRRGRQVDGLLKLSTRSGAARTYGVEIKQRMTAELATAVHLPPGLPTLLFTVHVGETVAEVLRARGIDYVDTAGNAHLAWDDVLIDVRGRRKPAKPAGRTSSRGAGAFGRAGLQVLFALLSWPAAIDFPYRRLAETSGVSLGTVKTVIDQLTSAGYLYEARGERRLANGAELLDRWSEAYSITLDSSLALGEFVAPDLSWWRKAEDELLSLGVQLGGEAAASLLDPHLRPASLTLYADRLPVQLIGRHRLARAENDANVHVRTRFWQAPVPESWIVPAPLIYADLLASGDPRQREHGDRIRSGDDRLKRIDRT